MLSHFRKTEAKQLIFTANHDYDDYIRSLKTPSTSIALIGYEHGGMLAGKDAATMIPRSLTAACNSGIA